jgi:hypothetical protein
MNTGAETIRIDRRYVPLLLRLKTAGPGGIDESPKIALSELEAGKVLRDGQLHPMADAILDLVAEPGLIVSVERMRLGSVAASTIWAAPYGATIGTHVDGGIYELKLANTALLPFHLFQLIHLRPLPNAEPADVTLPAEAMLAAEALLYDGNRTGAILELTAAGVSEAGSAAAIGILESRIASWRIHSLWSNGDGTVTRQAHGMDCGSRGHVLATIGSAEPTISLRTAAFADVTAAIRSVLPD